MKAAEAIIGAVVKDNHDTLLEVVRTKSFAVGTPATVNRIGSMFTVFFTEGPVRDFASAKRSDAARYGRFFNALLKRGVYFPPAQFEACFVSAAHTDKDIRLAREAVHEALTEAAGKKGARS